jgi:RNA polymerase-binding transcription factor DksA
MTARFEMSGSAVRTTTGPRSSLQADAARALLLMQLEQQTAEFAQRAAVLSDLAANSAADPTGRDRAMAAIRAYQSRERIEEIEAALGRIDDAAYGTCHPAQGRVPGREAGSHAGRS